MTCVNVHYHDKIAGKVNQRGEFFWLSSPQSLGSMASGLCALRQNIMAEMERVMDRRGSSQDGQEADTDRPLLAGLLLFLPGLCLWRSASSS